MNAICMHMAERRHVKPTDVEVELEWDENTGFSAQVFIQGRNQYLIEANMLEAVERYVYSEHGQRIFRDQIRLEIDESAEEMIALIQAHR
jgi:hypothetical protein